MDRDGVINKPIIVNNKPLSPIDLNEFEILPKVRSSLKILKSYGFYNVIVTNQPNITNKKQTIAQLNQIHDWILKNCEIDLIETCIHIDAHCCECRKPKTGMLKSASIKLNIPLKNSYMIGDRWKDILCGQNAGCKEVFFIDYKYNEPQPIDPYMKVSSLEEAVKILIKKDTNLST